MCRCNVCVGGCIEASAGFVRCSKTNKSGRQLQCSCQAGGGAATARERSSQLANLTTTPCELFNCLMQVQSYVYSTTLPPLVERALLVTKLKIFAITSHLIHP